MSSAKSFFIFGAIAVAIFLGYVISATSADKSQPVEVVDASPMEMDQEASSSTAVTEQSTEQTTTNTEQSPPETETPQPAASANNPEEATQESVMTADSSSNREAIDSALASLDEGEHYLVKFPNSDRAKGPVLVEFFSYMCPHCYRLEGSIKRWLKQKPADVEFVKIPVAFSGNQLYAIAARAHYIAEELGILDRFIDAMFSRIHIDRRPPRNQTDLANFFKELGVSDADFRKAAVNNFSLESKLRRANFLTRQYQVEAVPYLLVNYKYEVGPLSYNSEQALFKLWSNLPYKDF